MAPYEALYGRRCRSPIGWFEVGEVRLIGPDILYQAMEKVKVIQERLKTTRSRPKSYIDVRKRPLEFKVDDWVYLKVSPMKRVMRLIIRGNLVHGILDLIESPKQWAMWLMSWSYSRN